MQWRIDETPIDYRESADYMASHVVQLQAGEGEELVWFLQHLPCYTAGISAKSQDLLQSRFAIHETRRGGQYTYHGPGQRVIYAMLNLRARCCDVRSYVQALQDWGCFALSQIGIRAYCHPERIGLWVARPDKGEGYEDKIAAIGVRVQKYITSHGMAINIDPELSHFDGIVACGIADERLGVTSVRDLGIGIGMGEFDMILQESFSNFFAIP